MWSLVAACLLNLILNWLMLIPVFLAILSLPRFLVAVLREETVRAVPSWLQPGLLWSVILGAILGIAYI